MMRHLQHDWLRPPMPRPEPAGIKLSPLDPLAPRVIDVPRQVALRVAIESPLEDEE